MTQYRLPDALGGHPVSLLDRNPNPNEMSRVHVKLETEAFPLMIHLTVLEVVEEPLPPEPPNFAVVRVGIRPFIRNDDQILGGRNWHGPGSVETWREVCDIAQESTGFPPVLLVPAGECDTEAEPELPEWERELLFGARPRSCPRCLSPGKPRRLPSPVGMGTSRCTHPWHQPVTDAPSTD